MSGQLKFTLALFTVGNMICAYSSASYCAENFQKIGCYNDYHEKGKIPLPELLVTARDVWSSKFYDLSDTGWLNMEATVHRLLCECARRAHVRHWRYIGIQYYMECWGGNRTSNYQLAGKASPDKCLQHWSTAKNAYPCNFSDPANCFGKEHANFVYRLEPSCTDVADIAVLIDVSESMECDSALSDAKEFLAHLVEKLWISNDEAHVSLVTFSNGAKKLIGFDDAETFDKAHLRSTIDGISKTWISPMSTGITRAFELANHELFVEGRGRAYKVLITLTDAYSNPDFHPNLNKLEKKGVTPLVVQFGAGLPTFPSVLLALGGGDSSNVFHGKTSLDQVINRLGDIGLMSCSSK